RVVARESRKLDHNRLVRGVGLLGRAETPRGLTLRNAQNSQEQTKRQAAKDASGTGSVRLHHDLPFRVVRASSRPSTLLMGWQPYRAAAAISRSLLQPR